MTKLSVHTCSANLLIHLDICSFQYSLLTHHASGVTFGAGDTVGPKVAAFMGRSPDLLSTGDGVVYLTRGDKTGQRCGTDWE